MRTRELHASHPAPPPTRSERLRWPSPRSPGKSERRAPHSNRREENGSRSSRPMVFSSIRISAKGVRPIPSGHLAAHAMNKERQLACGRLVDRRFSSAAKSSMSLPGSGRTASKRGSRASSSPRSRSVRAIARSFIRSHESDECGASAARSSSFPAIASPAARKGCSSRPAKAREPPPLGSSGSGRRTPSTSRRRRPSRGRHRFGEIAGLEPSTSPRADHGSRRCPSGLRLAVGMDAASANEVGVRARLP